MSGKPPTADGSRPGAGSEPVSVVIPCYRCAKTIRRAVASVAAQTLQPLEVILVDDASGDDTLAELQAIAHEHGEDWVRVIELERNMGAGEARNAGWDAARGEFIAFLDADDAWHPCKIEVQYEFMRRNPEVALSGHGHRMVREMPGRDAEIGAVQAQPISYARLLPSNRFITPSAMLRRDMAHRFAPGKRHMEDFLLWLTIAASGGKVVRLDAELAYIFKAPYGETGLSAELVTMERAELDVYRRMRQLGRLGAVASAALRAYSLAKFSRRLVIARLLGRQGSLPWLFPLVYLTVTHSTTALLIAVGLLGDPALAAEIAIVHAATVATFHAFSANTRNLILTAQPVVGVPDILRVRRLLVVPLAAAAYLLAVSGTQLLWILAALLVLRRCVEWFNDVQLCEAERNRNVGFAISFFALQSVLFAIAALSLALAWRGALLALAAWALMPLAASLFTPPGTSTRAAPRTSLAVVRNLLAHTGSTAISGLALYAFRLMVVLLLEKALAGELFTAVAIGSFLGTLFANVLGPSLELHQWQRVGRLPWPIRVVLALNLGIGALLTALGLLLPPDQVVFGKQAFFWLACGLSLVGGVVMVKAQQVRLRVLRSGDGRDVFGPDVLIHMGLLGAVPLLIAFGGPLGTAALYLVNAILAYVFYRSSSMTLSDDRWVENARLALSFLLVFPLFFQLAGRIYNVPDPVVDSAGVLLTLPLPVSILACFVGIFLLGNYRRATHALAFVFAFFAVMLLAALVTTSDSLVQDRGKMLLLIQFLLPAFGLVLGQMFEWKNDDVVERGFFWACAAIVPAQLAATWLQGKVGLTHALYVFSVYQHWQYVPVVIACALLIAVPGLISRPRYGVWLLPALVLSLVYSFSAYSTLGTFIAGAGLAYHAVASFKQGLGRRRALFFGVVALAAIAIALMVAGTPEFQLKTTSYGAIKRSLLAPCADAPVYRSPLVATESGVCSVSGVPDPPQGYLLATAPFSAIAGDVARFEGELRAGALTVGLVRANAWAYQKKIVDPGHFEVEFRVIEGVFEAVVAAAVNKGDRLDASIGTVAWTPSSLSGQRLLTAAERGEAVLPANLVEYLPQNVIERIGDWVLFGSPLFDNFRSFFFGQAVPMDRSMRTSAHNYYIDLAYHFGVIALLPILALLGHTARLLWRFRGSIARNQSILWLAAVVVFLVVIDSNFKVTLRQPYPGIFAFFLWGLLLARLDRCGDKI